MWAKENGSSLNRFRKGRLVLFGDGGDGRLQVFINKRTQHLLWEDIILEMEYGCSV
jgi:hypothetical protein